MCCSRDIFKLKYEEIKVSNQQKIIEVDCKDTLYQKDKMDNYLRRICPNFYEEFELGQFLNNGSNGIVYEGNYKNKINQDKRYVFKFCFKNKLKKINEISFLKKLHQKNINKIISFIKINDDSYFSIFEKGKYGDLGNFLKKQIKKNNLSESCINYFTKQILEALDYIHKNKIIHLDIKEKNIIIDKEFNPIIIDFSISCFYNQFNSENIVKFPFVGTSKYMAPEILEGTAIKVKYAPVIDIYSLGITLYKLAFGIYPYNLDKIGNNEYDKIRENIKNTKLEFPENIKISEKFKDFLIKILDQDYLKRLNIKEALNHPWIKGWQILDDEKQNLELIEHFFIKLITNSISKFNEYIK